MEIWESEDQTFVMVTRRVGFNYFVHMESMPLWKIPQMRIPSLTKESWGPDRSATASMYQRLKQKEPRHTVRFKQTLDVLLEQERGALKEQGYKRVYQLIGPVPQPCHTYAFDCSYRGCKHPWGVVQK